MSIADTFVKEVWLLALPLTPKDSAPMSALALTACPVPSERVFKMGAGTPSPVAYRTLSTRISLSPKREGHWKYAPT